MKILPLFLNKFFLIIVLRPFFRPTYTSQTGFCLVPPFGPATPVIEIDIFDLLILLNLLINESCKIILN